MSERASSGVLHPLSSRHEYSHSLSQEQLLIILTLLLWRKIKNITLQSSISQLLMLPTIFSESGVEIDSNV